jgi:lipopolysaccharide export system protein LptA
VWTPKRIVLLLLGFALLGAAYWTYSRFLGGIDGLPALPDEYGPEAAQRAIGTPIDPPPNRTDEKLRQAFGEECPELNYAIRLEVKAKGMVLASKEFTIMPHGDPREGQVRFRPLSVALFGKNTPEGKFPEINTIRCNEAYLTFDQPITNPADMGKHKIAMAELSGYVDVINNRRTPERDDDLNVFTQGPVFYKDDDHHIWTSADVKLKDLQSKPDPMVIDGTGMDLYLAVEAPQPAQQQAPAPGKRGGGAAHKPKQATVSGVDHVILRQDVHMDLYVDGDSGFLGDAKDGKDAKGDKSGAATKDDKQADQARAPARAAAGDQPGSAAPAGPVAPAEPNKAHIVITTHGPFLFDVPKSYARFDIAPTPGGSPNYVAAVRFHDPENTDELNCEHLELQFHPKDGSAPRAVNENRSLDLEIESAHATGKLVDLKSDSEHLAAEGDDFTYDARTRQSVLKRSGPDDVWALKDANEVHARELRIVQQKGAQQVTAFGPGWIGLLDKKTSQRTQHASWKDQLVSSKDGAYDLLVLTQDASFEDEQQKQRLQADVLKVWLEPAPEQDKDADKKGAAGGDDGEHHGRRPHHVEAIGHVLARSPDMTVHDTDRLLIWFKDAVPGAAEGRPTDTNGPAAAAAAPAGAPGPAGAPAQPAKPGDTPATPAPDKAPAAGGKEPAKGAADQGKPSRPMDLSARLVEAHVLRTGERNDLDRLWTEGNVKVKQAPANPGEKGVDIQGETLKLIRHAEGNLLTVTGDLGQLRMDKIYIVGPVVNIDQAINKVWVNGIGAMQMDSDKTFDGRQLKEPVPLTVHWSHNMIFWGQRAEFHGGVQAEQETARLLCQSMDVFLDRTVSLKEGEKGQEPAKVRNLVADQAVRVESTDRDEHGRLLKYQRLECPTLSVDNEENTVHASGPGVVRILQPETDDDPVAPAGPGQAPRKAAKPGEPVMKLTRVIYAGGMYANNKNHTAIFTEDVHAVHLPSENVNLDPDIEHLPEGGMYLHCDKLDVYSRQEDGKASQQMKSDGHCSFRTSDSSGRSDMITYDESKSQVIFYGAPARPAELYRKKVAGQEWETIKAEKIIYIRRTGEVQTINTNGVQSGGR